MEHVINLCHIYKFTEEEIAEEENLENLSKEELIERLQNTQNQGI